MPLSSGHVLNNRYRVERLLSQGGMGAVYYATDLTFSTPVAIKENLEVSPDAQKQFAREAGLLHQLRHPNLPRVTDYFSIPGQGQYLVMDYVEGDDLDQILARQGPIPEAQAVAWIGQVLDALDYLHCQNVIHRDVKPANVKITPRGQVFLVDFGLAKVYDPALKTTTGARGVTPGYAPPEQYGTARTDARSDLYSVGATLYALLTGQQPSDALELVTGQAYLVPPSRLNPAISRHAEAVILRAMQTRPTDRFQAAAEFRAALAGQPVGRPMVPQPGGKLPPPTGPASWEPAKRARQAWPWLAVALFVVMAIALLGWRLMLANTPTSTSTVTATWTAIPVVTHTATSTWTPTPTSTSTYTPTPTATPSPTDTPTPTPGPTLTPTVVVIKPKIIVVALDDTKGRYDSKTSADDYVAILKDNYDVTVWSEAEDGAPAATDLLDYDLVVFTSGDFETPFGEDESTLLATLMLARTPVLVSGGFLSEDADVAVQLDVQVEDASHPVARGFTKGEVIAFVPAPSGQDYAVQVLDEADAGDSAVVMVRGPASKSPGAPSVLVLADESTGFAMVYIAFPLYLLPDEAKTRLVMNAVDWLLTE